MADFKPCDEFVSQWEGGNVDHPKDPGGRTSRGVTQAVYDKFRRDRGLPKRDVFSMTEEERVKIYQTLYWNKVQGGLLPPGFDLVVYDPAVNSGPSRGVKWFQKAMNQTVKAGVSEDGGMGNQTIRAASSAFTLQHGDVVIKQACRNRMEFLTALKTWATFGKGWGRRVAAVEARAVALWAARGGNARQALQVEAATARADAKKGLQHAGAAGAGGGGVGAVPDLPLAVVVPLGIALLGIIVYLVWRSRQDKTRAEAYEKEAKNGK